MVNSLLGVFEREKEGAALSFHAFSPNLPPMRLDQMPRNGNPQPCPTASAGFIDAIKALEDTGQIIRWNTDSAISNDESDSALSGFR